MSLRDYGFNEVCDIQEELETRSRVAKTREREFRKEARRNKFKHQKRINEF